MNRIIGIELLKFLAALMITNSHFKPLYPDSLQALGTLGAPGNALFFFISGYTLFWGRQNSFFTWYKRRISRIWPSLLVWSGLFYPIIFSDVITVRSIWLGGNYWFIHCIVIYYAIFWLIRKYATEWLKAFVCGGGIISILYFFFFMSVASPLSIYQVSFHYFCFFSVMVMGAYVAKNKDTLKGDNLYRDLFLCVGSLVLFYAIQFIGKVHTDWRYYFQITSLIPLHTFIWYVYHVSINKKVESFIRIKCFSVIIRFIAALTLELYLVGFVFIITSMNSFFPLNLLVVFFIIIIMAYAVKICSNILIQTIQDAPYNWKNAFVII